jgi:4-amino-4-deoxy-L-arabinose transferase-like glycosyltransferase
MAIAAGLLAGVFALQSRVPLGTAVQFGADEGFDLAKATLCLHGHGLYSEVWNDQPPLYTWLVTQVLKHVSAGILGPRLVTVAFAAILVMGVFVIVYRASGPLTGALTGALIIASPGFLELSSSCMLEIPALATAILGLGVLVVLPRVKWYGAEWLSGILFGMAALMKLVPLYLLPLAGLIVWLRRGEEGARETREMREKGLRTRFISSYSEDLLCGGARTGGVWFGPRLIQYCAKHSLRQVGPPRCRLFGCQLNRRLPQRWAFG